MAKRILKTQEDFEKDIYDDEEPEYPRFTWGDLKKILDKMPKKALAQSVSVSNAGSETLPTEMRYHRATQEFYLYEK
jgi:hypothetical protein